ncbi:MAG TPA: hypothetical protein VK881_13930 [bacterium]|nr:hypothetical protein [bacterium]
MRKADRAGRWYGAVLAGALVVFPLLASPLGAAPQVIPVAQIVPGMTGIGKTVFLGTTVSEFRVTTLGVLPDAGPAGALVLFRASGPAIEAAGGLAAGMSGSPIYFGDRLAGAFSYSFPFADPMIGLFTPIEDMLKGISGQARREGPRVVSVAPFLLGGRTIRRVVLGGSPDARIGLDDATAVAVPAFTPLFVAGLGPAAAEAMGETFRPMGLIPMVGAAMADLPDTIPLEPGSAIGVALAQGDVAAYAIGTLSYRDGDRVLGFGHPFIGLGHSGFVLTNATIFQVVRSQQHNMKVGAAGSPVGTISQDRPAGVGGVVGVLPPMFGVRVVVHDDDAGAIRQFRFQVVASKDLAPVLAAVGARGVVERALNRSGEGTAEVRMTLHGRMLPREVERTNIFYSGSDIAAQALSEVPEALDLLFENDFADVAPTGIEIDVRITKTRETATITEAEMPEGPAAPGETLRARVTVRPFREAPVSRDIELVVPENFPAGGAMLVVRSGGAATAEPGPGGAVGSGGPGMIRDLTDAISQFESREKNTDVVVELVSSARGAASPANAERSRASTRWTTRWILSGRFQAPIVVHRGSR